MPDATGLELIAGELRDADPEAITGTLYYRDRASLEAHPDHVISVIESLRGRGYTFLSSVHGLDYLPQVPRFGIHYELLDMRNVDRITVKTRVPEEAPEVDTVAGIFPTADFQEREIFDMFGVIFRGHPDLRRLHMPEDYEGHPQRRDFPIGGEPILFTHNEQRIPRWYD